MGSQGFFQGSSVVGKKPITHLGDERFGTLQDYTTPWISPWYSQSPRGNPSMNLGPLPIPSLGPKMVIPFCGNFNGENDDQPLNFEVPKNSGQPAEQKKWNHWLSDPVQGRVQPAVYFTAGIYWKASAQHGKWGHRLKMIESLMPQVSPCKA